jgi:cytochrome c-type biogenesis protein CcmI
MFIALIVLVVMLVALWLTAPLWWRPAAAGTKPSLPSAAPSAELRRSLRDLEFDRATGKVDEDEYENLKAATQRELESAKAARPAATRTAARPRAQVAAAEYSRMRWIEATAEAEIAIARARLRLKQAVKKCAQCGRILAADDKFCASCGTARAA